VNVCVVTDFYLREQRPDWSVSLEPLFRQVNLRFQRTGVHWKFMLGGNAYPEETTGDLVQRNAVLAEHATCRADVILGLTGQSDRQATAAVTPFSHTLLVALSPNMPEPMTATRIARALSNLYGVPAGSVTLVVTDAARGEIFNDASIRLISRTRDYDFAHGIAGMDETWKSRAMKALTEALAGGGDNPAALAHRTLGRAYAAGLRHTDAARQFREAVKTSPRDPVLRFELGLELLADSQPDEAIIELRECARLDPEDARPHAAMGAIYLNSHRIDQAVDEFRTATGIDPRNAGYQSAYGAALLKQPGRLREADSAFQAALRLRPTEEGAYSGLTLVAGMEEELRDAGRNMESEASLQPGSSEAHLKAGLARAWAGDLDRAENEIRRSIELQPSSGPAHLALARVKYLRGDYAAADSELRSAQASGTTPSLTFLNAVRRKLGETN
jgi:Tfp pilus assembly protein PilF